MVIILGILIFAWYKYYPTIKERLFEKYQICSKDDCNIDIYNIKPLEGSKQLYSHLPVSGINSMVSTDIPSSNISVDTFIDNYNDRFYGFYNCINNSSAANFDPVDMINYNDVYKGQSVANIYDQITKN